MSLVQADMRSFDLGRRFDVVTCLFGSIALLRSLEEARKAAGNMARHLAPGGILLIEAWVTEEAWEDGHVDAAMHDFPGGKIATAFASTRVDRIAKLDMQHLVATRETVEHISDQLDAGVWSEQEYYDLVAEEGLDTHYDAVGLMNRGLVIGENPN